MATEKKWRLQVVKAADRSRHIIATLTGTSTLTQLQSTIQEKTGVAVNEQILAFGFPPVLINTSDPSQSTRTLADIGIKHGDSIELRDPEVEEVEVKQGKGWDYPPTIDPKKGGFTRREMPKDNSCLFHTIAYICNNKQNGTEAAHQMREMAANLVASDPVKYNTTFLGAPNQVYQDTVMHPSQWGGAIELSIFSIQFQTEIVAFDPKYLREDVYGEGQDYKKRAFLLYTGDHYDALVYSPTSGSSSTSTDIVIFSIRDDMAYIRAREYVQSLHTELVKKGECQEQKEWRTHQGMSREKQQQQAKQKEELKQAQIASRLQQIQFAETKQDSSPTTSTSTPASTSTSSSTSSSTSTSKSDTWFCSVCTLENNPHATRCSACDTPSPFAPPTVTRASPSTSTSTSSTPVRPLAGNIWTCETCTVANPKDVENCEVCGAPNPHHATNRAPAPHVQSQLIGGYDDWEDTPSPVTRGGGGMSYEEALRTATSVAAAPWKCPSCEYNNPALTGQCGLCQTPFAQTPAAQAQILRTQNSTRARPRPTSTSPSTTTSTSTPTRNTGLSLFSSSPPNRWICESCGTDNHPNLLRCKACPNPNRALMMASGDPQQCIIS